MNGSVCYSRDGEIRFREKFCFFKYSFTTKKSHIDNRVLCEDWYWLEWITITEVFTTRRDGFDYINEWVPTWVVSGRHKKWIEDQMKKATR